MSRWNKRASSRGALLPLLLLALALGGTALYLASLNLLLTTTAWGQSLCHGWAHHHPQQQVGPLQDPGSEAQIFYQNVWEKHQFLYQKLAEERRRHRRSANNNRKNRRSGQKTPISAAHYEVKLTTGHQMNADVNGTIRNWAEVPRNSTSPVKYNDGRGEFNVIHKGLYYLYCQVHFNEDRSSYIKLELLLNGNPIFRCIQEFSATVASIRDPKLKTCSVSGLVILHPGNFLRISTISKANLRVDNILTYFGLFQVH